MGKWSHRTPVVHRPPAGDHWSRKEVQFIEKKFFTYNRMWTSNSAVSWTTLAIKPQSLSYFLCQPLSRADKIPKNKYSYDIRSINQEYSDIEYSVIFNTEETIGLKQESNSSKNTIPLNDQWEEEDQWFFWKVQLDFHHYHIPNYLPLPLEPHQQLGFLPCTENKLPAGKHKNIIIPSTTGNISAPVISAHCVPDNCSLNTYQVRRLLLAMIPLTIAVLGGTIRRNEWDN